MPRNLNTELILEMERRIRELPPRARLPVRPYTRRHLKIMAEARAHARAAVVPTYEETVTSLCNLAGHVGKAASFIEAKMQISDVQRMLTNSRAMADNIELCRRRPFEPALAITPTTGVGQLAQIVEQNRGLP